jgi:hypothetical protein
MIPLRTTVLDRTEIMRIIHAIQDSIALSWGERIKVAHGGVSNVSDEK